MIRVSLFTMLSAAGIQTTRNYRLTNTLSAVDVYVIPGFIHVECYYDNTCFTQYNTEGTLALATKLKINFFIKDQRYN